MIDHFLDDSTSIERLRAGPAGSFIDAFASHLIRKGYARGTATNYIWAASHLCQWLAESGQDLATLDEALVATYRNAFPGTTNAGQPRGRAASVRAATSLILPWLRAQGWVATVAAPLPPVPPLIVGFEVWLRQHRGVTPGTLREYRSLLVGFVGANGDDPARYDAACVRAFVLDLSGRVGRSFTKLGATALRMFLRYLAVEGRCAATLVDAVPRMAHWRLAALPVRLAVGEVERIVDACDARVALGRRDLAIVLLLSRLGLRSDDVADLRLADLAFQEARIRVRGKGRRRQALSLPQDVGDALIAYLADGRREVDDDHVFLTATAPLRALDPSAVGAVVVRAAARAGVILPRSGSHVLRHSLASKLLNDGMSLSGVGVVLRHARHDTTLIYAKVDVSLLNTVVQPWPVEVAS